MWKMETNNEIIKKDMSDQKRLYRSNDRILGGVCAGIAEYLDLDPTVMRVAYAVLTLFTAFCGIILCTFAVLSSQRSSVRMISSARSGSS